jgi:hypothetical protein
VNFYIYLALAWSALGAIQLYRAINGTRINVELTTLRHSPTRTVTRRQRVINAGFGVFYFGLAIAYGMMAYVRHAHRG